ncbi:protease inhibitor Inh/omp19 family protein [Phreatobacter sp.]|uniref:protease inhibitor Inh/omp19 family protein n=1 Tax=Phreatobacter sp. TaxID=1966341 RepID=UPI003F6E7FC3
MAQRRTAQRLIVHSPSAARLAALLVLSAALAGCTSSARFGSFSTASVPPSGSERIDQGFGRTDAPPPPESRPPGASEADVIPGGQPGETGGIESQEMAPPAEVGRSDSGPPAIDQSLSPSSPGGQPSIMADDPRSPSAPPAVVSSLPRQETARAANSPTAVSGTWTVTDAGDRCRITLTSTPLFEFYRASPQSCRAPSLARINAWEQRGSEIVLLQPGGRVAARLSPQGGGSYSGATATGAPVSMTR